MRVPYRAALALTALLTAVAGLPAQTSFKYRFKSGETLRYNLIIATKGSQRSGDTEASGLEKQDILMSWQVESVDDKGAAKIKVAFDRIKLSSENPKASVEATSDMKEEPEKEPAKSLAVMAKAMAKFAGVFTMTPLGEIKEVTIPEAVTKAIRAMPGGDKFADNWTAASLQHILKDSTFIFPNEPLAKGKSWQTKVDGQSPFGKLTGEVNFTYAGKMDRGGKMLEKFEVKPKLKIEPDPKLPVMIKTYETEGTVYFDNDSGKLVDSITVQTIEIQADIKGKMFTQKTEVTNSMKLVK